MPCSPAPEPPTPARLRAELAEFGVPLFERGPAQGGRRWGAETLAERIAQLAAADDARLWGALACTLAWHDPSASRRALERAAEVHPELSARLGLLYRLTRALVVSRAPDVERLLGLQAPLEPVAFEPVDLPDPHELLGERTLWEASQRALERHEPDVAGGVERTFDTWLLLLADERHRVGA